MEKEYEELKSEVGEIFLDVKNIILSLPENDKGRTEMNLRIIQAVIMRFIRMMLYQKHKGILCTSPNEILNYVNNGFLRHVPEGDVKDREKVQCYVEKLHMVLKTEKLNRIKRTFL